MVVDVKGRRINWVVGAGVGRSREAEMEEIGLGLQPWKQRSSKEYDGGRARRRR